MLKYPWFRDVTGDQAAKWGVYRTEGDVFGWLRDARNETRRVEAELMDWADDIAYSVHDIEDFYRAGLIPMDRLVTSDAERARFVLGAAGRLKKKHRESDIGEVAEGLIGAFPSSEPYSGNKRDRAVLRSFTSNLIARYVAAITLREPTTDNPSPIEIDPQLRLEVDVLKQLVWEYVILRPSLASQQHGQTKVIRELFDIFWDASSANPVMFPPRHREQLEDSGNTSDVGRRRVVIDMIAGMSERQAVQMHHRLTGASLGSVLDSIDR